MPVSLSFLSFSALHFIYFFYQWNFSCLCTKNIPVKIKDYKSQQPNTILQLTFQFLNEKLIHTISFIYKQLHNLVLISTTNLSTDDLTLLNITSIIPLIPNQSHNSELNIQSYGFLCPSAHFTLCFIILKYFYLRNT